MFGKIKDKLKNLFGGKSEEIEEQVVIEESIEVQNIKKDKVVEKKEKTLKKSKKDEIELDEIKQLEEDMLDGAPEEEVKAIKEKKELKNVKKNKEKLEKTIEKEEIVEKEEIREFAKKVEIKKEEKKELIEEIKEEKTEQKGFLSRTFGKLTSKKIDEEDFEKIWIELELFLLEINIAYEIVLNIETRLRDTIIGNSYDRFNLTKKIREVLVNEVEKVLISREDDLILKIKDLNKKGEIAKILVLGVNGTGKTTTIAKIVHSFQKNDLSVVVAAADTFRAAAVEQLDEHSKRVGFKLIKHKGGSDPAAVAFDAIEHARAKNLNVVLIDTAGRMPNNSNLMVELNKIRRVSAAQISVFVGDSISGNDLIDQIELFDKVVGIDGIILTKTDTDERPGSIVTAAYSIEKPIYYLGIGQGYDDLVKFDAKLVAEKLFEID